MAFWEAFGWTDWILILLIAIFLIMIIRNVYRLMKRRNEYMSFKEAQEQHAREHNKHVQSKASAVDADFEDESEK
ncbi:hypothetical protein MmiEs2_09640 [Methanimicrococcus stummii]|uniref:Uncharacterized protein n=1 Tax=Methanimicrococcus stummii TaxID=3028294 RepID=A0AA96ZYE5_9EURY|nr:hypothetical protein [Methanimicrococcus sp. Es2]WNY28761.1 hypothetical protein MmiEs2_09640 [Methanimicrococcus sp. Es2]